MITEHRVGAQFKFLIEESSQVAEVRRKVTALACAAGLDEHRAGICALVASEVCTNLTKHAKQGEFFLRTVTQGQARGIEILALDRGPGMANVSRALQDSHSTAGSSGTGLGIYLAREVCEANDATLDYVETPVGAQFTILCRGAS